jgi:hypothetical protein
MSKKPAASASSAATTQSNAPAAAGSTTAHAAPRFIPDRIWIVLARKSYEEPLHEVGTVEADDRELAQVYARSIYDEFAWVEMKVAPREAFVTVIES